MFDGFLYKMENKIKLKKVVFLLIFCFCSLKANSFCKRGWVYHSHTGTCMKIVTREPGVYFKDAKINCENIKGGNDGTTNGHLVFIFDEETDNFVKDLVDKEKVPDALIGLHDRDSNGLYHWGDDNEKAIYFGWKNKDHRPDRYKRVVVIDKDGWQEIKDNPIPDFICQVDAGTAYPLPKLTCPLVEIGKDSSKLTCSIETVGQNDLLWTTFGKSGDDSRLNCSNTECKNTTKLTGFPTIKESLLTYSMTIKNVEVTDETRWMCSVKFKGIPDPIHEECDLKVYITPEEPTCRNSFTNRSIVTECISEKAYPQAKCSWEFSLDNNVVFGHKLNDTNIPVKSGKFFKTTCSSELTVHTSGCYFVSVFMEPDLPGPDISHISTRQNVNVCIEPPMDPPKFSTTKFVELFSYLNTTENKTVDLTCSVEGGTPPVWKTRIECDKGILTDDATHMGNSVTTQFSATRAMDGKFCRCEADFITNEYIDETTIMLSVKYPSTVSSFDINGSNNQEVEVAYKTQLRFKCSGTGKTTPRLSLDLTDDKKQMVQLETVTSQSLQYEMTASCNTSSQYLCTARNDLNEKGDAQIINLKVQCTPQHCNTSESNPKFGIPVNGKGTVTMCVYAHPQPTNFKLSRKGAPILRTNRYSAKFEYIDERRAKGKITLTVTNLTECELGNYQLYSEYDPSTRPGAYLYFQLAQDCNTSYFGDGCLKPCSQNCKIANEDHENTRVCDQVDGRCLHGCINGFEGDTCSTQEIQLSWYIVGIGVSWTFTAIILIVLLLMVWRSRKRKAIRAHDLAVQDPIVIGQDDDGYEIPLPVRTAIANESSASRSDLPEGSQPDPQYESIPL